MRQFVWNYQSLQLPTYHLPSSIRVTFSGAPSPAPAAQSIQQLTAGTNQTHRLPTAKKPEASANPQQATQQNLQPPAQGQHFAQRQQLAQPQTAAAPITPANASTAPKDGVLAQKLVQKNSEVHGDDRYSKNGFSANPLHKVKPLGVMPRPQQMR